MAIAKHRTDIWAHVQEQTHTGLHSRPRSNIRLLPAPRTVHLTTAEPGWHTDRHHERADELLKALDNALGAGRARRAARLRAAWLHQLQLDRIAAARDVARQRGLRLDPMGRGPIPDSPTVHYRDRLPWGLQPVDRLSTERLPDRAATVISEWNGSGKLFDALLVADEPTSSGQFPVHALVGAISSDGRSADWFVLDRWAS